jgi:hypothetical protein
LYQFTLKELLLIGIEALTPHPMLLMILVMLAKVSNISFELASTPPSRKLFGKSNFSRLNKDQTL